MANVVVTGGAGFIGSHLVDKLISKRHKVMVVDNLSTGLAVNINKKARFVQLDIREYKELLSLFRNIHYVFHLAALPRVQRSVLNPLETNEVNVQGTMNVLEAARQTKVKRVIFASSSSVYGNQNELPLVETMIPKPLSPYALQKLIGEKYCSLYSQLYGLETVSLRFFSVYGPRQNESETYATIIGKFLYLKKKGELLPIYGDGSKSRDFTYVFDAVSASIKAMEKDNLTGEIINVCTGREYSVNAIAKMIHGKVKYHRERLGESKHTRGDNTKAKRKLMWEQKQSLTNYLEHFSS